MAGTAIVTHRRAASIAAVILAAPLAAAPCRAAEPGSPQGRWRSDQRPALTLDIARCAQGWCGVIVDADGRCGPRALTIARIGGWGQQASDPVAGRLVLPGHARPYQAQLVLAPGRDGAPRLHLQGVEEGERHPFARRIFPVQAVMARIGDAGCTPAVS